LTQSGEKYCTIFSLNLIFHEIGQAN
jgi:hypothetical protein